METSGSITVEFLDQFIKKDKGENFAGVLNNDLATLIDHW